MNLGVVAGIVALLFGLSRLKLPFLVWIALWPVSAYILVRYGITPLVPASVMGIYLSLVVLAVFVYLCTDSEQYETVTRQLTAFLTERRFQAPLAILVLALPAAYAARIYTQMNAEISAPTFGRTIHPAPPNEITFKGKRIDLIKGKNPLRELEGKDPQAFQAHLKKGKEIYYRNCVYCHGDDLHGDGIFAHGFNPVPADLNSPTTIGMLQESFLFWRISKGGPGLPEESGPWSSSMPAWEKFLEEEEIWSVILFLYDYTGLKPRAEEEHH